jgi:hypothetical protein
MPMSINARIVRRTGPWVGCRPPISNHCQVHIKQQKIDNQTCSSRAARVAASPVTSVTKRSSSDAPLAPSWGAGVDWAASMLVSNYTTTGSAKWMTNQSTGIHQEDCLLWPVCMSAQHEWFAAQWHGTTALRACKHRLTQPPT